MATETVSATSGELHTAYLADLLPELVNRALPQLSEADMRAVESGFTAFARGHAEHLARVAEGAGCLVSGDNGTGDSGRSGSFQGSVGAAQMLFWVSSTADTIAGLLAAAEQVGCARECRTSRPEPAAGEGGAV